MMVAKVGATKTSDDVAITGNRADPEVRRRLSGPAMRSFLNISDRWELTVEERRALLGWPAESTYHGYKKVGKAPTLSFDMLTRISLVLGMFKALHILYPDPKLADRWIKLPNTNPMFAGKTPMAFMIDGGIDSLHRVRRLLDARRGGWN
jgi:hypothetical protein